MKATIELGKHAALRFLASLKQSLPKRRYTESTEHYSSMVIVRRISSVLKPSALGMVTLGRMATS